MSAQEGGREFVSPPRWRCIDFISDLHLSSGTPRTFEAWARHLQRTPADAVFMLGDLFEAWVGDDARGGGFEGDCLAVLREAARLRTLAFMAGNRDFLVGSDMLRDGHVTRLADPTLLLAFGERALLTHGDALCLADVEYQRFRAEVRSPAWQSRFLALPLAERRRIAQLMRDASETRKRTPAAEYADIDSATALQWLADADAPIMIHGHTHRPASVALAPGRLRHVLSDWDLDQAGRAEVLRWTAAGFKRLAVAC